jgi:hypothetical protein
MTKGIDENRLREAILEKVKEQRLSCADAHQLAEVLQISTREIGKMANTMGIKIKACELGCF